MGLRRVDLLPSIGYWAKQSLFVSIVYLFNMGKTKAVIKEGWLAVESKSVWKSRYVALDEKKLRFFKDEVSSSTTTILVLNYAFI